MMTEVAGALNGKKQQKSRPVSRHNGVLMRRMDILRCCALPICRSVELAESPDEEDGD